MTSFAALSRTATIGSHRVQTNQTVRVMAAVGILVVAALAVASWGMSNEHRPRTLHDAETPGALRVVAIRFNDNYAHNRVGLVYDRWDAASRAIIARAEYVRRHRECPDAPGPAIVESVTRGPQGFWRVRYAIDSTQLVDYWHYVDGAWRFNLVRSNPDAVRLYKMPFSQYARQVGCGA